MNPSSPFHKRHGLARIAHAFLNSVRGFRFLLAHEAAFRQELLLAIPLTVVAFFMARSVLELVILVGVLWLVVAVEILNTAVEVVVNRIGTEFNELSGVAKDLGSLAVLVALALATFVWVAIGWDILMTSAIV